MISLSKSLKKRIVKVKVECVMGSSLSKARRRRGGQFYLAFCIAVAEGRCSDFRPGRRFRVYIFRGLGVLGLGFRGLGFRGLGFMVNPRKLEHRFRMIHAGIPNTLL